jgi:hypothetical protein
MVDVKMSTELISMADYWMGRDRRYSLQLESNTRRNAELTVRLANEFLAAALAGGVVDLEKHPANQSLVVSGWRPPQINAATKGAAPRSNHISGRAIDLYDPDGDLDAWSMSDAGHAELEKIGLWLEHPSKTLGWCHIQTVPPKSGKRVFMP